MRFSNWQNKFSALWLLILCVIALALGAAWLNKGIKVETNIFALLPEAHQDAHLEQAQQYVSQQLNDKVFVVLDAKRISNSNRQRKYSKPKPTKVSCFYLCVRSLILINLPKRCISTKQGYYPRLISRFCKSRMMPR